jgi:hypothetical protein
MARLFLILGAAVPLLAGCYHRHVQYSYQSPYNQPLVSPGLKFLSLPAAVQNSIRAQGGATEILDIGRYEVHGDTFYKIWFRRGGSFPPLYVARDGSILNSDLTVSISAPSESYDIAGQGTGLRLGDLPSEVVKTIQSRAKTQEIEKIQEALLDNKRIYEVHFKNSRDLPMIKVDQDGKVVEDSPVTGKPST